MKRCTGCGEELPISEFSPQKRNPAKLYAWCDNCRRLAVPERRKSLKEEYAVMKAKAIQLRKTTPEQDADIKRRYTNGENVKVLASEYGVSEATVYKVIHRVDTRK